jgi:hypothetical protein
MTRWSSKENWRVMGVCGSSAGILAARWSARVRSPGRARYDRTDKEQGSVLLSKGLMEMAYWGLQPVGDFFILLKLTPNAFDY